jgi:enterochelin esterase-like enzyme
VRNWPYLKLKGKVDIVDVEFPSLKGNPLQDPWIRSTVIYSPCSNSLDAAGRDIPVIIHLPAFFGTSHQVLNRDPFSKNLFEQADTVILKQSLPFILIVPDGFTSYGGSQYLNSSATGNYEDMIARDLVDWIQKEIKIPPPYGLIGRSSGGYGALTLGMKHPELFSAIACHSGDLYFEWCYKRDFPEAIQVLKQYSSIRAFLSDFWKKEKPHPQDFTTLNVIAMSACYSPNSRSPLKFDLPFDLETSELVEEIWRKWLNCDPVVQVNQYAENLKKLKLLFLDCGNKDEYFLHLGARIFAKYLKKIKVPRHYEEYPDGHRGTGWRFSVSLPLLARSLQKTGRKKFEKAEARNQKLKGI